MRDRTIVALTTWITLSVAVAASGLGLYAWMQVAPRVEVIAHVPGLDGGPTGGESGAAIEDVNIGEHFQRFDATAPDWPGRWPRFRGANYDNIYRGDVALLDTLEAASPPVLWSVELGEGHAGPAVYDGRVYVLDYDEAQRADALRCFALDSGQEIWRRSYHVTLKRNHGMSRSVPSVNDGYVVTIGPNAHVMCVTRLEGKLCWGIDMMRDYGSEVPPWYTAQCPVIDGDTVVLAPAGRVLMMGVDIRSGEVTWTTPNVRGLKLSHSSIIPMDMAGRKTYVYAAIGGVVGIAADGADRGRQLWEYRGFNANVIAPAPVMCGTNRIFLTAGYGGGSAMIEIVPEGDRFAVIEHYRMKPDQGLACEQHTPIYYEGLLFGVLPKDAGVRRRQFIAFDPRGEVVWQSGKSARFGLGPFMLANDRFLILDDRGTLTMARASTQRYEPLGSTELLQGSDSWGPLALVNGLLLARDSTRMICVDLRKYRDQPPDGGVATVLSHKEVVP